MKAQNILRNSGVVTIEGVEFVMDSGDLQPGDSYIAERNVGPQLLTVREFGGVGNPLPLGLIDTGWVHPVEDAYPYDMGECVKVKLKDS